MSAISLEPFHDARRRARAPYRVPARLEIVGLTKPGEGLWVSTQDANEWGMRLQSSKVIPSGPVLLKVPAPDGSRVEAAGEIIYSRSLSGDLFEAGIEFHPLQPRLAASRIDRYSYGS